MADVNLLSYGWSTNSTTSNISVKATSEYAEFRLSGSTTTGYAKACIEIDASKYSSISLSYSRVSYSGIEGLIFGIFDSMDAKDKSGIIILENSDFDKKNGGYVSESISLTGTKYVGFRFYGNGNTDGVAKDKPYINYLIATEKGYTLTYNANGGSGGPSSVSDITSTTISSAVPTRSGYEFLGWSTSSSATSASYVAGNSITLNSNITLYAVWRKLYTITYNANGGSGAPSSQTKTHGAGLTLSTTKPTKANASANDYTVTLDANGGVCSSYTNLADPTSEEWLFGYRLRTSGEITSCANNYVTNVIPCKPGDVIRVKGLDIAWSGSNRSNCWFLAEDRKTILAICNVVSSSYNTYNGWTYDAVNAIFTHYVGSNTYQIENGSVSDIRYFRFNGQLFSGYTENDVIITVNQEITPGNDSVASMSLAAKRTVSYNFSHWNTSPDGTGVSYNAGASYYTNADLTLYAIYNVNESTASVELVTPIRDGYEFIGWATSIEETYGYTGSYTPTGNVTLYAIWKPLGQVYICDKLGGYSPYKVLIRDSSGWNQYVPYIYTYSGWQPYTG